MNTHFINYVLLAVGIFTILAAVILIFLDKLKGDDMYFNIDVKEQEIKKVIEDAEEILSELNFTSDVIVKEIEDKINNLNKIYRSVNNSLSQYNSKPVAMEQSAKQPVAMEQSAKQPAAIEQPARQPAAPSVQQVQSAVERTTVPVKFKPITIAAQNKAAEPKSKQQMIFELADKGESVTDIAKKLNIGQGEVALILSLKTEEN